MCLICSLLTCDTHTPCHTMDTLLLQAEAFVKEALRGHDGSHDFWHISRVRASARVIAQQEGLPQDRVELVELCALLHDVDDWKYACAAAAPVGRVQVSGS